MEKGVMELLAFRWRDGRIMKLLSCCGLHTIFHILLTSIITLHMILYPLLE